MLHPYKKIIDITQDILQREYNKYVQNVMEDTTALL